jgi:cytochrome c-type biogenesis protein CcmH
VLALLGALVLLPTGAKAAVLTPQEQAEGQLMCYCGCSDLTVRTCNCGTAAKIKADIAQRLADGQTVDQVVAAYVAEHGEQMRSAPVAEGFNLLAWIMPFAAILAGALMVVALTRRWKMRAAADGPPTPDARGGPAPDLGNLDGDERRMLQRIEREIREDL